MARVERILIFGATSAMAQSIARLWAADGASFYLVGRNLERLEVVRADLVARGAAAVGCRVLDFADIAAYESVVTDAAAELDGLTLTLVAHGELTDQARAETDAGYMVEQMRVNLLSCLVAIHHAANHLAARRGGTIVIIGSVAGDRGRRSNYVYGAAKSALAAYAEGLRARLAPVGVRVLLVKPGLIDTPMTANIRKNRLYSTPDVVARDVVRAVARGRDVIYTPFFWRYVMLGVRLLPGSLFKKVRF